MDPKSFAQAVKLVEQCAQGRGPFSNVRGWPENVDPVENFQVNGKFHACHRQVGGAPFQGGGPLEHSLQFVALLLASRIIVLPKERGELPVDGLLVWGRIEHFKVHTPWVACRRCGRPRGQVIIYCGGDVQQVSLRVNDDLLGRVRGSYAMHSQATRGVRADPVEERAVRFLHVSRHSVRASPQQVLRQPGGWCEA